MNQRTHNSIVEHNRVILTIIPVSSIFLQRAYTISNERNHIDGPTSFCMPKKEYSILFKVHRKGNIVFDVYVCRIQFVYRHSEVITSFYIQYQAQTRKQNKPKKGNLLICKEATSVRKKYYLEVQTCEFKKFIPCVYP